MCCDILNRSEKCLRAEATARPYHTRRFHAQQYHTGSWQRIDTVLIPGLRLWSRLQQCNVGCHVARSYLEQCASQELHGVSVQSVLCALGVWSTELLARVTETSWEL